MNSIPAVHQYNSIFIDTNVIINLIQADPTGSMLDSLIVSNATTYITSTVEAELRNNLTGAKYAAYSRWAYQNVASGKVALYSSNVPVERNAGELSIIRAIEEQYVTGPYLVLSGDNGSEADFGTTDTLNSIELFGSLLLSGEISYASYARDVALVGVVAPHELVNETGQGSVFAPGMGYDVNGVIIEVRANGLIVNGTHVGYLQTFEINPTNGFVEVKGPENCFLFGTCISLFDGSVGSVETIAVGDDVLSYDSKGNLTPGRVTKLFRNKSKHILDFHGLMVTPGHVTYCSDGKFAGQHVPLLDILRSDGAVMHQDGHSIRASTGCPIGSEEDKLVLCVRGDLLPEGIISVKEQSYVRAGHRFLTRDGKSITILDLIQASGASLLDSGMVLMPGHEQPVPFYWSLSDILPKPEDYVLQRSQVTLSEIFEAAQWEEGSNPQITDNRQEYSFDIWTRSEADIAALKPNIPLSLSGQVPQHS